jgi:hypothetical protein
MNGTSLSFSSAAGLRLNSRKRSRARFSANASICTSKDGTRLNVTRTFGKASSIATIP